MPALQPKTEDGKRIVRDWWAAACARSVEQTGAACADGAMVPWAMPLDVYLTDDRQRQNSLLADACAISPTTLAFRSRHRLPLYAIVVLCPPGMLDGVRARITDKQQTLGGYRYNVEFQHDVRKTAACINAA